MPTQLPSAPCSHPKIMPVGAAFPNRFACIACGIEFLPLENPAPVKEAKAQEGSQGASAPAGEEVASQDSSLGHSLQGGVLPNTQNKAECSPAGSDASEKARREILHEFAMGYRAESFSSRRKCLDDVIAALASLPPPMKDNLLREAEKPEWEYVCDHCGQAACWQGKFYCEKYKTAGVRKQYIAPIRYSSSQSL